MKINVIELPATYKIEDGQARCTHEDVDIEWCCQVGTHDCSCQGLPAVVCMNYDCTGIEDNQQDELMGRFEYDDN